jgi:riboflavin synthase
MFTGIVEEIGEVISRGASTLHVRGSIVLSGTKLGDSIAVNGACLTVTDLDNGSFKVGLSPETLRRTNIGSLRPGDKVNLERAMKAGDRIGGHFVQGHVDATIRLLSIRPEAESRLLEFSLPAALRNYVVEKGFVALDGTSLTVTSAGEDSFTIALIPFTIKNDTLGSRKPGYEVNLEVDILGKYVERALSARLPQRGVTERMLEDYGYK